MTLMPLVVNYVPPWQLASAGKPFVVVDMLDHANTRMKGWTCDTIRSEFADAKMHQEYTAKAARDIDDQRIGDASWMTAQAQPIAR